MARKKPEATQTAEVVIERVAHRGDGVATLAGEEVYVPFTLPGERAEIERRGARGTLKALLRLSPDRVAPACRHFGACGGCSLQHWRAEPYRAWKREQVVGALAARGLQVEVEPLVSVPATSRRRTVLSARRAGSKLLLGYHQRASDRLIDIEECPVLTEGLAAAVPGLRDLLTPLAPRRGTLRITVVQSGAGLDVAVEGAPPPDSPTALTGLAAATAKVGIARLVWEGELLVKHADPVQSFDGVALVPPPGGFLQASAEAEGELARLVLGGVGDASPLADLFAGSGTLSLRLARVAPVTAVEADQAALDALAAAARRAGGLKPITVLRRDLMHDPLSAKELGKFAAVVFDPPRAGAAAQAETLAASKVKRVVAMSCNPATLARDLRILVDGGYRLERLVPVDQFVFSPHIEAVAWLVRG